MDTLHSILMALLQGVFCFIPASNEAHQTLLVHFLGIGSVPPALLGILSVGSLLALLIYFRHDWASIISSGLRILLLWKRPMMLDERMPLFLLLSTLPIAAAWFYFHDAIQEYFHSPAWVAGAMIAGSIPLWMSESMNRRNKTMSFWNWKDSLILGFIQIVMLIPGIGRQAVALTAAFGMNYNRESAYKFAFYSFAPILAAQSALMLKEVHLKDAFPHPNLSWMSFWVAGAVSLVASLFTIGYMMKNTQSRGVGRIVIYRCLVGGLALLGIWLQNR